MLRVTCTQRRLLPYDPEFGKPSSDVTRMATKHRLQGVWAFSTSSLLVHLVNILHALHDKHLLNTHTQRREQSGPAWAEVSKCYFNERKSSGSAAPGVQGCPGGSWSC